MDRLLFFIILKLVWRGFPPYPPRIEKNWKPESHAEEAHCSEHVILFTALSATPTLFPTSFSSLPSLSPGRASTKSSLIGYGQRVRNLCTDPLNFKSLPR